MFKLAYSSLLAATAVSYVSAQSFVSDPLVSKVVPYTAIPEQVDTHTADRGPQYGYNICNSTTENQDSLCQTGMVNYLDDFCLFAPPKPNMTIGDSEGIEVAWCTKKGRGSRLIPEGALQGVQLIQSPGYIQIAGFIDQTKFNIQDGDFGGELDSGGQDGRGNPIGGLVYSNAFPSNNGNNGSFQQARHWTFFMGGGAFCGKVCDDTQPNAEHLCEHVYDRIGCAFNAPNNAQNGSFVACKGDDMMPVGTYVSNGATLTWSQPPESVSITGVPYTPTPAPSSQCVTYTSSSLYTDLASVGVSGSPAGSSASATAGASNGGSSGSSGSATRSGSNTSQTGTSNSAGTAMGLSLVSGFAGVILSVFMFS